MKKKQSKQWGRLNSGGLKEEMVLLGGGGALKYACGTKLGIKGMGLSESSTHSIREIETTLGKVVRIEEDRGGKDGAER